MKVTLKQIACSITLVACLLTCLPGIAQEPDTKTDKLKVLLVAGGCCHDYATQTKLLKEGIESRINADVAVIYNPDTSTKATFKIYESDDWAKGYDVVLHDECSANVTEKPYVDRILAAHRNGTPAVNLHCAMHSYRWGDFRTPADKGADNAGWYEMIGVQSTAHGPKAPIEVKHIVKTHPITTGMEDWKTINEELYNNVRVYEGTTALIMGKQITPPNKRELKKNPDAKPKEGSAVVAWTNEFGPNKTKIFSTSLGHQNETVGDPKYLDLVARGLLWATDNITDEGKPTAAYAVGDSAATADKGKLIFEDDFERNESDESAEAIGNGWESNSRSRAGGNKQVDLRDGSLHIYMHKTADHAVSVRHDAEFKNGSVQLRFMLEHAEDRLGLNFADLKYKAVHAGHLFKVEIGTKKVNIADLKTGVMDLKIREKRKADQVSPELKKLLATKSKKFDAQLEVGKWYALDVTIAGDKVSVEIDGEDAGSFSSEGIAHPTKRMLRLSVPKEAVIDDLKIYSMGG